MSIWNDPFLSGAAYLEDENPFFNNEDLQTYGQGQQQQQGFGYMSNSQNQSGIYTGQAPHGQAGYGILPEPDRAPVSSHHSDKSRVSSATSRTWGDDERAFALSLDKKYSDNEGGKVTNWGALMRDFNAKYGHKNRTQRAVSQRIYVMRKDAGERPKHVGVNIGGAGVKKKKQQAEKAQAEAEQRGREWRWRFAVMGENPTRG